MTAQRPGLTSAHERIKVGKNIRRGCGRAHRKGECSMSYGRIGVIGAMDSELAALIAALAQPARETVQGLTFHTGLLSGRPVVLVRCGIGKVSAARCTQVLIDRFAPAAVINTGIAGGLGAGLAVGDIVVADGLVQHDFDAAPIGFVRGCLCMGDPGAPTVFTPDERLSALLARTAGDAAGAQRVHRGLIATGDRFISGAAEKAAIRSAFPSAMAAEMEGGAVAQAASMSGVPFAVVRAISDLADGTAAASFEQFEQHAADISARAVMQALAEPDALT